MARPAILIAAIAAGLVLGIGAFLLLNTSCACEHDQQSATTGTPVEHTPAAPPTACGTNPAPALPALPTDLGYRALFSPTAGAAVSSPLRIVGEANPAEGLFTVTIFDRQGRQIATRDYRKDVLALAFDVPLPFEVTSPMPACVWVYERDARDGTPSNVAQVPVQLIP